MSRYQHFYIIKIQYLGFRYHGWQKQPGLLTVERMVSRTLAYVFDHKNFKIIASGRTDAKVSVNETYIELFLEKEAVKDEFLEIFNANLPQDIRALSIQETDANFNIIQHPKEKEYTYLFTYGEKMHPFCAPFMVSVLKDLDIALMREAAKCFVGTHNFKNFIYKPTKTTNTNVTILHSEIVENTMYTGSFFPKNSYLFRVVASGFKRHQVRLMMGALLDLGSGVYDFEYFKKALKAEETMHLSHIAQASGLMLQSVKLLP